MKAIVYATDSCTEIAIKDFLKKMNSGIEWTIRSPQLRKQPKSAYMNLITYDIRTGRTGNDLEEFMIGELRLHPSNLIDYSAILLEDDFDKRTAFGNEAVYLLANKQRLQERIQTELGNECRIILLYASPEIEAWFFADWVNGFGSGFLDHLVAVKLKKRITDHIMEHCNGSIESYIGDKFSKLIEQWLNDISIEEKITNRNAATYNKRIHGSKLLTQVDPNTIKETCRILFSPAYREISEL